MVRQRILVVDDTPANITIFNELLRLQYHVSVATNGHDALDLAGSENKPDLILLDIMMPEMNGYEVCKRLKSNSRTSKIPVIFVTAMAEVEDESKGFELGGVDYITKPISPPIVLARIKTQLELKHALEVLEGQNKELVEAGKLREDVERITQHDMKNPLAGIFAGVDVLEFCEIPSSGQLEAIEVIKDSAHRILEMINSSLDLFKMEQKRYQLKLVDVDLIDIIHRIENEFKTLIQIFKTGIHVKVSEQLLNQSKGFIVKGETLLLYCLLANLIKNAIEAIPENEKITISLKHQDNFAKICIHNPGCVPEEIQSRFFDKYATSGKLKGTGLGTYSAKLMVQTLGGRISFTSSEDEGTTIFIHFPLNIETGVDQAKKKLC